MNRGLRETPLGQERASVSTKLSAENEEFLYEWLRSLRPYDVSESGIVNKSLDIVRTLVRRGELSLEPKALQAFLENGGNGSNAGNVALPANWPLPAARKALRRNK
jgi:hypothetical protein